MNRFLMFLTTLQLATISLGDQTRAEIRACESEMKSYLDVISCALNRSPEGKVAIADVAKAKAEVGAAGQWKNPEISAASIFGRSGGQLTSQVDLEMGVPLELGGKVAARREVAESGVAQAEARAYEVRTKIQSEVLLKLHRLRQLLHEQEVIDEAIGTFGKLVMQFGRRPKLSPEQQLSNTVFRMSKSAYEIKRMETVEEMASLRAYFKVTVNRELEDLKNLTPESPKKFPDVTVGYRFGTSPRSKVAQADLVAAQASQSLAQSDSWPTVVVGPVIQVQSQGGQVLPMAGLSLGLPVPLFNMNGGGRFAAASGVSLSETKNGYVQVEEERLREALIRIYGESKRVLGMTLSHNEIERRHEEMESLFLRGIVPSALVIEAHRIFVELEIMRNQRELKAIDALLSILAIDGKISEVVL